jgi:hypothetical protein
MGSSQSSKPLSVSFAHLTGEIKRGPGAWCLPAESFKTREKYSRNRPVRRPVDRSDGDDPASQRLPDRMPFHPSPFGG